jgi:hypothetical protein
MPDKKVEFIRSGRGKARCAPDPRYPMGMHVAAPEGTKVSCFVQLPYPAPECGMLHVECETCGLSVLISVAGHPDDAVSVELACENGKGKL